MPDRVFGVNGVEGGTGALPPAGAATRAVIDKDFRKNVPFLSLVPVGLVPVGLIPF